MLDPIITSYELNTNVYSYFLEYSHKHLQIAWICKIWGEYFFSIWIKGYKRVTSIMYPKQMSRMDPQPLSIHKNVHKSWDEIFVCLCPNLFLHSHLKNAICHKFVNNVKLHNFGNCLPHRCRTYAKTIL